MSSLLYVIKLTHAKYLSCLHGSMFVFTVFYFSHQQDVVLVNQDNPEVICLECIGHVEQTMAAVPDLETYVQLGK